MALDETVHCGAMSTVFRSRQRTADAGGTGAARLTEDTLAAQKKFATLTTGFARTGNATQLDLRMAEIALRSPRKSIARRIRDSWRGIVTRLANCCWASRSRLSCRVD